MQNESLKNINFSYTKKVKPTKIEGNLEQAFADFGIKAENIKLPTRIDPNSKKPLTKDGKLVLKEIAKGFVGSVTVDMGPIYFELSLMHTTQKAEESARQSDFKLSQPWNVTRTESGRDIFEQVKPFDNDKKDTHIGIGNTYAKKAEDGTLGAKYASVFMEEPLWKAIQAYVDHLCTNCVFEPASTSAPEKSSADKGDKKEAEV